MDRTTCFQRVQIFFWNAHNVFICKWCVSVQPRTDVSWVATKTERGCGGNMYETAFLNQAN